jgi:hypothetical protein
MAIAASFQASDCPETPSRLQNTVSYRVLLIPLTPHLNTAYSLLSYVNIILQFHLGPIRG